MRMELLVIAILLLFTPGAAQPAPRPRIGLVLSGGGAKGMAHVGVIKVLEEAGIRPAVITGTSMGAIVGALYAAGYTARELETIVQGQDWNRLLLDRFFA
jgi:NTE family protein